MFYVDLNKISTDDGSQIYITYNNLIRFDVSEIKTLTFSEHQKQYLLNISPQLKSGVISYEACMLVCGLIAPISIWFLSKKAFNFDLMVGGS